MPICPNQHDSQAVDFCTVCGIEMSPADSSARSSSSTSASSAEECPTCHAKRASGDGDFCEVCGYNFKTGICGMPFVSEPVPSPVEASEPLPSVPTPAPAPVEAVPDSTPTAPSGKGTSPQTASENTQRWQLVATIDLSITNVPEAEGPADLGERIFPLDLADQLIGRRSTRRGIFPEISLDTDDGISHRHARILRQSDGGFSVLDLGSSNGTRLNGQELKPNLLTPIIPGDRICVGRWTCLTLQART